MHPLTRLINAAGQWTGTSRLMDPHMGLADNSESTLAVTPILHDSFVSIEYTWKFQGKEQQGLLLVGCEVKENILTMHWIDSWHMGNKVMALRGNVAENSYDAKGAYAAPPGPDWGWRITLDVEETAFHLTMHNIWPEGKEELAVLGYYSQVVHMK